MGIYVYISVGINSPTHVQSFLNLDQELYTNFILCDGSSDL